MKPISYLLQKLHEAKNNNEILNFVYREHSNDLCSIQIFYVHCQVPNSILAEICENYYTLTQAINPTNYISVIAL